MNKLYLFWSIKFYELRLSNLVQSKILTFLLSGFTGALCFAPILGTLGVLYYFFAYDWIPGSILPMLIVVSLLFTHLNLRHKKNMGNSNYPQTFSFLNKGAQLIHRMYEPLQLSTDQKIILTKKLEEHKILLEAQTLKNKIKAPTDKVEKKIGENMAGNMGKAHRTHKI